MADEIAGDDGIARLRYFYSLREQGYTLLLISETTEWCDVCEAQMSTLPAMVDTYGFNAVDPQVAFLTVVTEDDSLNSATLEVASNYSTDHDLDHVSPVTNDENLYFRDLMTASSYPFNIFVDLANMEIIGYA